MKILLVEDDPATADGFADYMAAAGHDVHRAATGEKALVLLATHRYDAAAIDLVLPACTGDGVAAEASRRNAGVVLMSAATPALLSTLDDLRESLEAVGCPVSAVVSKPVPPGVLLAALEEAARRAKASPPAGRDAKEADPMRRSVSVEDVIGEGEGR